MLQLLCEQSTHVLLLLFPAQSVEKLELIGMDFIWKIAMESPDEEIANEAIQLIINYSYINLTPRLKKVGSLRARVRCPVGCVMGICQLMSNCHAFASSSNEFLPFYL